VPGRQFSPTKIHIEGDRKQLVAPSRALLSPPPPPPPPPTTQSGELRFYCVTLKRSTGGWRWFPGVCNAGLLAAILRAPLRSRLNSTEFDWKLAAFSYRSHFLNFLPKTPVSASPEVDNLRSGNHSQVKVCVTPKHIEPLIPLCTKRSFGSGFFSQSHSLLPLPPTYPERLTLVHPSKTSARGQSISCSFDIRSDLKNITALYIFSFDYRWFVPIDRYGV